MAETRLIDMKGCGEGEDRLSMLDRFDPPRGEAAPVPNMDLGTCPDRENPLAHIAAWRMAFGEDPNAVLLMKVKLSRHKGFVRKALIDAIGASKNIRLIEEQFSDAEITGFQRMADVYLSLHRAEGYGLNIHEMLELGIPTIATGWSGNVEFMRTYKHAHAVDYRLVPYHDKTLHYQGKTLHWSEPDVAQSAALLRVIRTTQESMKLYHATDIADQLRIAV